MSEIVTFLKYAGVMGSIALAAWCLRGFYDEWQAAKKEAEALRNEVELLKARSGTRGGVKLSYRDEERVETAVLHLIAARIAREEEDAAVTVLQQVLKGNAHGQKVEKG